MKLRYIIGIPLFLFVWIILGIGWYYILTEEVGYLFSLSTGFATGLVIVATNVATGLMEKIMDNW